MFNIHEIATIWQMQTLIYSTEKRVIRKGDGFLCPNCKSY
jgi:hypothetical protein